MFVVFFLFWLILNGRVTLEITVFGIVISAAVYAFFCKFLDYSPRRDLVLFKRLPWMLAYLFVLIWEIIKANVVMARYILLPGMRAKPALVRFHSGLTSPTARVILADSITMTPGTITVELEEGDYCVHCYDKSMGEGLESSVFVRLLARIEAIS